MGKWEEYFFRLDFDSLKYYSADGSDMLGEFPLDTLEKVNLEAAEFNFVCQGRKSRLRDRGGRTPDWYAKLRSFMPQEPEVFEDESPARTQKMPDVASDASAKPQSRVDMMHERHKQKLDKLQEKREQEATDEKKRLQESGERARGNTLKARGKISPSDVQNTADRLFNEHKFIQERLEQKRMDHEKRETDRIADTKMMNMPTRSTSETNAASAREAGDRLYSDAERRELWKTQARDAQAKDELTMVRVGVKGSSASSQNRCHDLHKEAVAREDKLKKARDKNEKEKADEIKKKAVPCGEGRKGVNLGRIEKMYTEHMERQKKLASLHAEAVLNEQKDIAKNQVAPRANKTSSARRQPPPWKDAKYPFNLPKKVKDSGDNPQSEVKNSGKPTHRADNALKAIEALISLRAGYLHYNVRPSDYAVLVTKLKKIMKYYSEALTVIQADSGFASLCSRSSQRLFQEHLLPEVEGWSHRLEPDPIRQVEDDIDALLGSAAKAQASLKEEIAGVHHKVWAVGTVKSHPTGVPMALFAYDPGVKTKEEAETKAKVCYGPGEGVQRHRHLTDLSRLQLVFSSCDVLQAGLEHILKRFEVVDVRNHFNTPGRLGQRFVEVLVVVIVKEGREQIPHVCEIRLVPLCFNTAEKKAAPTREEWHNDLERVYAPTHMDRHAIDCIAEHVLSSRATGHQLKKFRCHLARRFGSTVCAWRKAFGGGRLLNFQRFREVCYSMHCGENVTELWQEMDPNRGGCISLWELDPDSVALLVRTRSRMLGVLSSALKADADVEETDANVLFQRLTTFVRPNNLGVLEQHEFRAVAKPLGLTPPEADRVFSCLDHFPGSMHAPPATIDVADIQWLKRITAMVDVEMIAVQAAQIAIGLPGLGGSMPIGVTREGARRSMRMSRLGGDLSGTPPGVRASFAGAAGRASVRASLSPADGGGPVSAWGPSEEDAGPGASQDPSKSSKAARDEPKRSVINVTPPSDATPADEELKLNVAGKDADAAGMLKDLGVDVEDDDEQEDEEEDDDQEEEEEDDEEDDDEEDEEAEGGEETW